MLSDTELKARWQGTKADWDSLATMGDDTSRPSELIGTSYPTLRPSRSWLQGWRRIARGVFKGPGRQASGPKRCLRAASTAKSNLQSHGVHGAAWFWCGPSCGSLQDLAEVDQNAPRLCPLNRQAAQELVLLSVLSPFMVSDLAAKMDDVVYATDASEQKGAYVWRSARQEVVRAFWRTGRQKTSCVRLPKRGKALVRKFDMQKEEHEFEEVPSISPERPRAHRFHFIEVCGGSGEVSRALSAKGCTVGPVLNLDSSPFYNLRFLKVLSCAVSLLGNGLLDCWIQRRLSLLAQPFLLRNILPLAPAPVPEVLPLMIQRLLKVELWEELEASLCLLVTAITWGWIREAGVLALSFSSARHQAARLDQTQLLLILRMAFENLIPDQKLWPTSAQTIRTGIQKLLKANGLDGLPSGLSRGLDLGSLRAGGGSWLLRTSEDSELTRRRGRWISSKVMEIYVQEISNLQFLPKLPERTKVQILSGAALFPWSLANVFCFSQASIPPTAWYVLFRDEAVFDPPTAETDGGFHKLEETGEIEQHGMSVMPCKPSSQHGAKRNAGPEKLPNNFKCPKPLALKTHTPNVANFDGVKLSSMA
eukprot:s53_g15.t1